MPNFDQALKIIENILLALRSIGANLTRTIITCLIISIGIMALVGILTAIDGVESSLVKNFSFMGANSFNIQGSNSGFTLGRNSRRQNMEKITYKQALEFQERFEMDGVVSVFSNNTASAVVKYGSEKTNPNTMIIGGGPGYQRVAGYTLESGRNLTQGDLDQRRHVAVIGQEMKEKLFDGKDPIDKIIKIGGVPLRVVGVFGGKGSAFDFGGDRIVLSPVTVAKHKFPTRSSYNIGVAVDEVEMLNHTADYSTSIFRQVRKLKAKEGDNFKITKSDNISRTLMENLNMIIVAAVLIAVITLLGAAIALMNIMLVSVTERTKEIGIRKAIGARNRSVLNQFIIEAVTICQLGGLGGIILGMLIGNLTSNLIGGDFIVPWDWMLLSIVVCTVVGLASGIWPAYKAAAVDPIEALRHE